MPVSQLALTDIDMCFLLSSAASCYFPRLKELYDASNINVIKGLRITSVTCSPILPSNQHSRASHAAHLAEVLSNRDLSLEPWREPQAVCLPGLPLQLPGIVCPTGVLGHLGEDRFCGELKPHPKFEDSAHSNPDVTYEIKWNA